MTSLRPYNPQRRVEILSDLWTATKKGNKLRVEVRTSPQGWELRALVGLEMQRSQVCKTEAEVFATSDAWKAESVERGWTDMAAAAAAPQQQ